MSSEIASGGPEDGWLVQAWQRLDLRSRDMLTMRAKNRTLDAIGRAHGVTRERVRQIVKNAQERLSAEAWCASPVWADELLGLLEKQAAISDDELAKTLHDPTGIIRVSLMTAEGFCHPRAWSEELTDHWALRPDVLDVPLRDFAADGPYRKDELKDHARAFGIPDSIDIYSVMASAKSPLVLDESGAWVRKVAKKRDVAYLWLAEQGEPQRAELIAEVVHRSAHAITESLRRDYRFRQVRPEGTWALADWPLDEASTYANALEAMIGVLTELGPLPRRELFAEVMRRYPVSYSRVQQCLISTRIGVTPEGRVGLVEQGAMSTEEKEPRKPENAVHDEELGLLAFSVKIDREIARGSGVIISPWITWRLGLRQAPMERTFTLDGSNDRHIVLKRATSGAQMSSLRREVVELGLTLGCNLAVVLRLWEGTLTIRHVCASGTCPAS